MRFLIAFIIMSFASMLLMAPAELMAQNSFQRTGVKGKVTVQKDGNGKTVSVTITDTNHTYIITPGKAKDTESAKTYTITEAEIEKIAKYENQIVQVGIVLWNGKPIEVGSPVVFTGVPHNKI